MNAFAAPCACVADAAPARGWHRVTETDDLDLHAHALSQWTLQYDQLSGGAFHGCIEQIHVPGAYVVRETINRAVRQRGEIGQHRYGFAVALDPLGEALCNGQRLDGRSLLVGRGDDLDLCNAEAFQIGALSVECDLVNDAALRMFGQPLAPCLDQQVVVPVGAEAAQRLRAGLLHAFAEARQHSDAVWQDEPAVRQLRDAMLLACLEALPLELDTAHLKSVAARRRVVDRACDMMLAHVDEPPSLLQVCSQIGTSHRKLNYCFQDVLGTSPARYLRAVRLNGVRRQLKSECDPRMGVQDIAAHWGFWHLGQFSCDYKHQFAELPSQTLRTARTLRTGRATPRVPSGLTSGAVSGAAQRA